MRTVLTRLVLAGVLGLALPGLAVVSFTQSGEREPISVEQFEAWMEELSNWGRWGEDDELGAVNLMTPAKRKEAAGLVRSGTTVSLAHDFLSEEAADVREPYQLQMSINHEGQNSGDRIEVYFHGIQFSHLDGLCHVFYNDRLYNGHDYRDVVTEEGCSVMDTAGMRDGLVTKGVLVDMPRLKGVPYLEPGTKLYAEDIEAWEEMAGVSIGSGDALLLRTGRWARRAAMGAGGAMSGWDASVMPWMAERDIALLGADSVHEAPDTVPGLGFNPIHGAPTSTPAAVSRAAAAPVYHSCGASSPPCGRRRARPSPRARIRPPGPERQPRRRQRRHARAAGGGDAPARGLKTSGCGSSAGRLGGSGCVPSPGPPPGSTATPSWRAA